MAGEIDVRPETLDEVARLLRERASSLSGLRSLGPGPDAGESTGEVDGALRQVEQMAAALAAHVTSTANRVADSRDCYVDADERVRRLVLDIGRGDAP